MRTPTLRQYLLSKKDSLYEEVNELKDKLLSGIFNERDAAELEKLNSQLFVIKEVIAICSERGKF